MNSELKPSVARFTLENDFSRRVDMVCTFDWLEISTFDWLEIRVIEDYLQSHSITVWCDYWETLIIGIGYSPLPFEERLQWLLKMIERVEEWAKTNPPPHIERWIKAALIDALENLYYESPHDRIKAQVMAYASDDEPREWVRNYAVEAMKDWMGIQ